MKKEQRCFTTEEAGRIIFAAKEPFATIWALIAVLGLRVTLSFQRAITQGGTASQEKVLSVELNPSMTVLPPADSVAAASNGQTPSSLGRTAGGAWEIQPQKAH